MIKKECLEAGITDENRISYLIKKCGEVGVNTIKIDGMMDVINLYKKTAEYEGKRCTSLLKTFATVMSLLALEAGLVYFSGRQDARDTRKYIQLINSQLEQTKSDYSNAYELMKSGKFEEAARVMEEKMKK